jgi:NADP-dependent 3-hydroxy acid dehydrogenase YdfG
MAATNKPIAVVTGASSGIGAATARALAKHGYTVVGGARRVDRVKRALGTSGLALELDVTERESVERFVGEVRKRYGRVDVLINNAGGALGLASVADANDDDWTGMWKVNVFGLMLMTRACLPLLRKAKVGHIVNIGSIAGFDTYKGGVCRVRGDEAAARRHRRDRGTAGRTGDDVPGEPKDLAGPYLISPAARASSRVIQQPGSP